jgi:hypothetical protein
MALLFGVMAAATATIRVARETRDLLAEQARARGLYLSSMLAELARDAALCSEREASRADARGSDASAEEREWETTLADGLT